MTVLTQVSTKPPHPYDVENEPLVIPRGPSNAKLALLAAAITFVAITAAILFLRSRRPDDAVASPAPPSNVEPSAAPAGEPPARPSPAAAESAKVEPEPQARARRRSDAAAVGQPAVDHEGLDASAGVQPAQPPGREARASAPAATAGRQQRPIVQPRNVAPERVRAGLECGAGARPVGPGCRGAASDAATFRGTAAAPGGSPRAVARGSARCGQPARGRGATAGIRRFQGGACRGPRARRRGAGVLRSRAHGAHRSARAFDRASLDRSERPRPGRDSDLGDAGWGPITDVCRGGFRTLDLSAAYRGCEGDHHVLLLVRVKSALLCRPEPGSEFLLPPRRRQSGRSL